MGIKSLENTFCHTDLSQPSKSLILQICYPSKHKISTAATKYGIETEKLARDELLKHLSSSHENVQIVDCGLFRSVNYPYLGATPDGLMTCSCCEVSFVIEIKCPFKCTKISTLEVAKHDPAFCMEFSEIDGRYHLKRNHVYYYQVQLQMLLTNRGACYCLNRQDFLQNNKLVPHVTNHTLNMNTNTS